jgi:predicted permease
MRAAPGPVLVVVLTLGLAIGCSSALFGIVNALLLRPLPVRQPDQLVTVTSDTALRFGFKAGAGWNYSMWSELRQRAGVFGGAFAWTLETLNVAAGDANPEPAQALVTSGEMFPTLDITPAVGRFLAAGDDAADGGPEGPVAVVSDDFWQHRLGGAAGVIGTLLKIDHVPVRIVGIAPRVFRGVDVGQPFDVALTFGAESLIRGPRALANQPSALVLTVMLRLGPGQSLAAAQSALRALQPQILAGLDHPPPLVKEPFVLEPAATGVSDRTGLRQRYERPLVVLWIITGLLVAIACVNVANVMLGRTAARRHELAVRAALGAVGVRLASAVAAESLVVAALGAALGALFAGWLARVILSAVVVGRAPVALDRPVDWTVLGFVAAIGLVTAVLFGSAPAWRAMRVAPFDALQDRARGTSARAGRSFSHALIGVQVAFSMVLVTAMALFVGTLSKLASVPLGMDVDRVLVIDVDPVAGPSTQPGVPLQAVQSALDAIASAPGVARAAASVWTPFGSGGGLLTNARGQSAIPSVAFNLVSPGWFEVYGIRLSAGRSFDASDTATSAHVAIVNDTLARKLSPDGQLVGRPVTVGPCQNCEVVGVVSDAVYGRSLRDAPPPTVYLPLAQSAGLAPMGARLHVSARTDRPPLGLGREITAALRALTPTPVFTLRPLRSDVGDEMAQERLVALLASAFGVVALQLTALGLYGVTSYGVARRRVEIGIRIALGSQPAAVIRLVLLRTGLAVIAGLVIGIGASLWLSRYIAPLLYGVAPRSPAAWATAAVVLIATGVAAAWLPTRRASRVDPIDVLRQV